MSINEGSMIWERYKGNTRSHTSCTLVPIHPPKYEYARMFLKNFHERSMSSELCFVFTNESEYNQFLSETSNNQFLKHLDFQSVILDPGSRPGRNIITFKKLYGISELFNQDYDFIGVFDCDSRFVRKFDTDVIYPNIYNSGSFKSNLSTTGSEITNKVTNLLMLSNNKNLNKLNPDSNQYWWFNEICVYEKKHFSEFYRWLKSHPNYRAIMNEYLCFDYILYSLWLISFKEFQLNLINDIWYPCSALEHNFDDNNLSYAYRSHADANRNYKEIEHIKVLIHVDRSPHPDHLPIGKKT